jgi:hypothetical protein
MQPIQETTLNDGIYEVMEVERLEGSEHEVVRLKEELAAERERGLRMLAEFGVNRRLLWLNLLLLLSVVFIPFPASLLGTGFNNPLVVRLYGVSLIATNLSGLFFWLYASTHTELMVSSLTKSFARTVVVIHSSPMLGYGLAVVLAGWSPKASLVLYAAVPLFFILPNPLLERRIGAATRSMSETQ